MRRSEWAGLAGLASLALLMAACASGVGAPTGAPSAEAESVATGAPGVPLGLFTGHDTCGEAEGDNPDDDITPVVCDRVTTDPRLTGEMRSADATGSGQLPDLFTEWRTFELTNDDGAWTCKQLLIGQADSAGWADQVCTGKGGYAGLTAYVHGISANQASDFGVLGWIEETP